LESVFGDDLRDEPVEGRVEEGGGDGEYRGEGHEAAQWHADGQQDDDHGDFDGRADEVAADHGDPAAPSVREHTAGQQEDDEGRGLRAEHQAHPARPAAVLQHGEGQGDGHHAAAQDRSGLRGEQPP
jgi:hypothetical protein